MLMYIRTKLSLPWLREILSLIILFSFGVSWYLGQFWPLLTIFGGVPGLIAIYDKLFPGLNDAEKNKISQVREDAQQAIDAESSLEISLHKGASKSEIERLNAWEGIWEASHTLHTYLKLLPFEGLQKYKELINKVIVLKYDKTLYAQQKTGTAIQLLNDGWNTKITPTFPYLEDLKEKLIHIRDNPEQVLSEKAHH